MSSFSIRTPRDFLEKLINEQGDLHASDCLSARHAINATMTAYHLHEWVWGGFAKKRNDLHRQWQLQSLPGRTDCHRFFRYLATQCPSLAVAEKITNGTKHFDGAKVGTGEHHGAFGREFSSEFDISYLWVERKDLTSPQDHAAPRQRAEEFIKELVEFWQTFFATYSC
jgi:hypothetical protein